MFAHACLTACMHRVSAENGTETDPAKLKAALRTELDDVARRKALQGYEIPREFIVEMRPFSKENHLLTDSNKPARGQMKKRCVPFFQPHGLSLNPRSISMAMIFTAVLLHVA